MEFSQVLQLEAFEFRFALEDALLSFLAKKGLKVLSKQQAIESH